MNKKISCLIVDDEPIARKGLELYVQQIGYLDLKGSCEDVFDLDEKLKTDIIDLLFLDIQMPQITGLEYISRLKTAPKVIFTTAHSEYALQGFELDVLDYLLKPISADRFEKACLKAKEYFELKSLSNPVQDYLFIKSEGKFEKLHFNEILYVEARENYLSVIRDNKSRLIILSTLKAFLLSLPAGKFIQTHKSFVVAVDRVTRIEGSYLYLGAMAVPVARNNKQAVNDLVIKK